MGNPGGNDNFFIFYPIGKAGGAQVLRCQGIAVNYYGFTLGALALNPSGFCNAGVDATATPMWENRSHPLERNCPGRVENGPVFDLRSDFLYTL